MYAIWLDPIELIAVDSDDKLVLAAPAATAEWTCKRFGRLLAATASEVGCEVRFGSPAERCAICAGPPSDSIPIDHNEEAG